MTPKKLDNGSWILVRPPAPPQPHPVPDAPVSEAYDQGKDAVRQARVTDVAYYDARGRW